MAGKAAAQLLSDEQQKMAFDELQHQLRGEAKEGGGEGGEGGGEEDGERKKKKKEKHRHKVSSK